MKPAGRFHLTKVGGADFRGDDTNSAPLSSPKLLLTSSASADHLSLPKPCKTRVKKPKDSGASNNNRAHEGEYILQSKNDTWQQFGKIPPALERPATRKEIRELHARFDQAMHLCQRDLRQTRAHGTGLTAEPGMEQDLLAAKEQVKAAVEENRGGMATGRETSLAAAAFEQKWADIILGEVEEQVAVTCLEQGKLIGKIRRALASAFRTVHMELWENLRHAHGLYEQVESGKRTVAALEGKLEGVRGDVKQEYDALVFKIQQDALEKQRECEAETREAEAATEQASEALITLNGILRSMKADSEGVRALELNETCKSLTAQLHAAQRRVRGLSKVKDENEKLQRDNQTMQEESAELHQKISHLEDELQRRQQLVEGLLAKQAAQVVREELAAEGNCTEVGIPGESSRCSDSYSCTSASGEEEDMQEVQVEADEEATVYEDEAESVAQTTDVATPDVEDKQPPSSPKRKLTRQKSKRGKKRVVKRKGRRKTRVAAKQESPYIVGKKLLQTTDTLPLKQGKEWVESQQIPEKSAAAAVIRQGMDASAAICIKCKADFEATTNVDSLFEHAEKRLPCSSYRILLPNLMGYKPHRVRGWVLRCMRSILRSKRRQDFANDRINKPRRRLAEYVYSWFIPREERLKELEQAQGKDAARMALAKADEHRWGFFYGLKLLMQQLPEAELFYAFLDERFGEDDFAFYIHVITVVEAVTFEHTGQPVEWGLCTDAADCDGMEEDLETADCREEDQIPDYVLVELKCAKETVKRVIARAGSAQCKRVLKSLADKVPSHKVVMSQSGKRMIDLNIVVRVLMQEYRNEQAHRKAAMRVMFGAASSGEPGGKEVDLQQLSTIVKALNSSASPSEAADLYRLAHELGAGKVNLKSFTKAAEMAQFFTTCLRLPPHFGTEAPSVLRFKECTRIGTIVRTNMLIMEDTVRTLRSQLDPGSVTQLDRLCSDVKRELSEGKLVLDGRRSLCALRRLVHFLLGERMNRREIYGEPWLNGRSVAIVEKELRATIQVLNEFEESEKKELLENIRSKWSAAAIQRNWRRKHVTVLTIPPKIRELLSGSFEARAVVEGQGKKIRVARVTERSKDWAKWFLSEIFAYKLTKDSKCGGPASSFPLEEAIHATMLNLYGVRAFAERQLYDLLLAVRKYAKEDILLRCFAAFVGLKIQENDRIGAMDAMPEVEAQGTHSLSAWHSMVNLPEALKDRSAVDTFLLAVGLLRTKADSMPVQATSATVIAMDCAKQVIKDLFKGAVSSSRHRICGLRPGKAAQEATLSMLESSRSAKDGVAAMDVLLCVLQGWLVEDEKRREALTNISLKLQEKGLSNVESIVSFLDFKEKLASLLFEENQMEPDALMRLYTRMMSHSEPSATLTLYGITKGLEDAGLHAWRPACWTERVQRFTAQPSKNMWNLLRATWDPLEDQCSSVLGELGDRARAVRTARAAIGDTSATTVEVEELVEAARIEHKKFCERYCEQERVEEGQSEVESDSGGVAKCWEQFRRLLHAWQGLRHYVGEDNQPLQDKWDVAQRRKRMKSNAKGRTNGNAQST